MRVPLGRPTIAHRFNGGFTRRNEIESRRDDRKRRPTFPQICRPSGACSSFTRQPTVETVGYFLSPLRGCADTSALEREMDRQVYALYPPAAKFRQTGGPTPEEINIVEEAG